MQEAEKQRTDQQRKSIELFCRFLAKALNDAGMDQRKVFAAMREGVEIPWSQETVKENLWKQIQEALFDKKSTTELEPKEVSRVYEVLNRFTGERFGVSLPFPDRFSQADEKHG
jgi:hypothetical protein